MATESPTAFFSYSRDDSEFTLRLAGDLKAAGAKVWLDQLDIEAGQNWPLVIQDALSNAQRVLVVLSPSAVKSSNVMNEVTFALEEGEEGDSCPPQRLQNSSPAPRIAICEFPHRL